MSNSPVPVFLDATVFVMGFTHPEGNSVVLLNLARKGRISICSTREILLEADRNLRSHAAASAREAFHRFLKEVKIRIMPDEAGSKTSPKFLKAIKAAKAALFFTLDKRLLENAKSSPVKILTPKSLFQ